MPKELSRSSQPVKELCDPLRPSQCLAVDTGAVSLPYHSLQGIGFERLLLNILAAEGKYVRFFGNPGQRDYGVDLVVEENGAVTVYQCKNYATEPSLEKIKQELVKFQNHWLEERKLPPPAKYVYCCPHSFSDLKRAESWLQWKEKFKKDVGSEVVLLTRETLDEKLKRLPDIVADVFSSAHAEFFCKAPNWGAGPWTKVTSRPEDQRAEVVRHFLSLHHDQSIYLEDDLKQWFAERADTEKILMLRGLPGSGKTTTALELTVFQACLRLRHIYYCSLKDGLDVAAMVASIRQRNHIPSCFILDDCHLDLTTVQRVLERLHPELNSPESHIRFILLARYTPVDDDQTGIEHPLVEELNERDCCHTFSPSKGYLKKVIEYRREDLRGLAKERLDRLFSLTGGDLLLLDEVLKTLDNPADIDTFNHEKLFNIVFDQYFGSRLPAFPAVQALCCLAQFDIEPLRAFFDDQMSPDENRIIDELSSIIPAPDRYRMLHSSLAELLFHALCTRRFGPDPETIMGEIVATVRQYLRWLLEDETGAAYRQRQRSVVINNLIYSELSLVSGSMQNQIKIALFSDPCFTGCISSRLNEYTFWDLRRCAFILAMTGHACLDKYVRFIAAKLTVLPETDLDDIQPQDVLSLGAGLHALEKNSPSTLARIFMTMPLDPLLDILATHGGVQELFQLVGFAPAGIGEMLIQRLDRETLDALIQKTINTGRSIGTLNMAMWKIGKQEQGRLARLEKLIDPASFIRLIKTNGTLFELFMILQDATPAFADRLIQRLDRETLDALIQKTGQSGFPNEYLEH